MTTKEKIYFSHVDDPTVWRYGTKVIVCANEIEAKKAEWTFNKLSGQLDVAVKALELVRSDSALVQSDPRMSYEVWQISTGVINGVADAIAEIERLEEPSNR